MGWWRKSILQKSYTRMVRKKWYILMYSTCNGDKSVIAERFIKTLKAKIHKKMTANDNKFDLSYLRFFI